MTVLDRRMKFLDTNNPQKPGKCAGMQKFKKDYNLMIQASDRYSNNLKLRLNPGLSTDSSVSDIQQSHSFIRKMCLKITQIFKHQEL